MSELPAEVFGHWMHSREEDTPGVRVYRPADHPFPPARWRHGLELLSNGTYIDHRLGPDDRSRRTTGRWVAEDARRIRLLPDDPNMNPQTLDLVSIEPGLLKVRGM